MKKIERSIMERIFKYTCLALLAMLLYCIPGFIAFQDIAQQNGLHFVSRSAWNWCIVGFVIFGVTLIISRSSNNLTTTFLFDIWVLWLSPNIRLKKNFTASDPLPNKALIPYTISLHHWPDTTCSESNVGSPGRLVEMDSVS